MWGFFCPPSTQLQGHLHLKWELGPLAARLLLIAGLRACSGTKRANAISRDGALHIKDPRLPCSSLPATSFPSATFHHCRGGCHPSPGEPWLGEVQGTRMMEGHQPSLSAGWGHCCILACTPPIQSQNDLG